LLLLHYVCLQILLQLWLLLWLKLQPYRLLLLLLLLLQLPHKLLHLLPLPLLLHPGDIHSWHACRPLLLVLLLQTIHLQICHTLLALAVLSYTNIIPLLLLLQQLV
jgi:hypothetical protein